jgi:leucyl/phenylalanyl-tRNA--protein transferase
MSVHTLDKKLWFPPVEEAMEDGLLAMGGDVSVDRLLLAYKRGIFPWYDGDIPLWWCPDPRFVLYPNELKVSKSMKAVIEKGTFDFSSNMAFNEVIQNCKNLQRKGQDGTWITDELEIALIELHKLGFAHSAETWLDGELVGGLYGIRMGKLFFGESMFSKQSNASKFAFIRYVDHLRKEDVQLIDCQVHTEHLESLGARMISRNDFKEMLKKFS